MRGEDAGMRGNCGFSRRGVASIWISKFKMEVASRANREIAF
jgi:hypothetical protein